MATTDSSQPITTFPSEPQLYEDQFIRLLKEITKLQWVRESLPVQSKYYEGLKQRHKRELHLKELIEKQLQEHRKKQDASSNLRMLKRSSSSTSSSNTSIHNETTTSEPSYSELIERLRNSETKISDIETQLHSAESMLQDLRMNKHSLDTHCMDLHSLYDEIIPDTPNDPAHIIEQHLKKEVIQLANDIPRIENEIQSHTEAQTKLYEARENMEKAMMSLPGASTFLDRQALASRTVSHHSLFGKSSTLSSLVEIAIPTLKDAANWASKAYELQLQASKLCREVPVIPHSIINKDESVMNILTAYRGYRLKIETILRTQLNPRLIKLQSQLAMTRYHYEQKSIEWIDQQITMLENLLRENGCLQNINLDREISMLRMGSNAAIVAVAAETSGRVTVDDALEVSQANVHVERNGNLPEYSANAALSTDTPRSSFDALFLQQQPPTTLPHSMSTSSSSSSSSSNNNNNNNKNKNHKNRITTDTTSPSLSSVSASTSSASTLATTSTLQQQLPAYTRDMLAQPQGSHPSSEHEESNHSSHPPPSEYQGPEAPPAYFR
ncbi:unnamed protein product [Cunninghamella blakesleeana]